MFGTRRIQLAMLLAGALVFANATPSEAGLGFLFGGSHGSSGGSSGGHLFGSSGGSLGSLFHFGHHGSHGSSGGSSGGCSGGSGGIVYGGGPMAEGYMIPAGAYQGYVPMMGQGVMLPPATMPMAPVAGANTAGANAAGAHIAGQQQYSHTSGVVGSLGQTYHLPSKQVNSDIHPRVGLLEITVSEATFRSLAGDEEIKVSVEDEAGHFDELEGYFGDDDKWHFESEPLNTGIPHLYDVKFEVVRMETKRQRKGDKVIEVEVEKKVRDLGLRRLRLIPNRTVYLNFP